FADEVSGARRPGVVAIADGVALVGVRQGGPGFRANAGIVVTGKVAADFNGAFHGQCFGTRLRLAKNRRRSEHLRTSKSRLRKSASDEPRAVRSIVKSAALLQPTGPWPLARRGGYRPNSQS